MILIQQPPIQPSAEYGQEIVFAAVTGFLLVVAGMVLVAVVPAIYHAIRDRVSPAHNMSSSVVNEQDGEKDFAPLQSEQTPATQKPELLATPTAKVDITHIEKLVEFQTMVRVTANILHIAKQSGKPLSETKVIESVFNVTASGSNKRWTQAREAVTKELATYPTIDEIKKVRGSDTLVSVGGPGHRLGQPDELTQQDDTTPVTTAVVDDKTDDADKRDTTTATATHVTTDDKPVVSDKPSDTEDLSFKPLMT
jgi:MFS superfamily sulfate permease-like transporter